MFWDQKMYTDECFDIRRCKRMNVLRWLSNRSCQKVADRRNNEKADVWCQMNTMAKGFERWNDEYDRKCFCQSEIWDVLHFQFLTEQRRDEQDSCWIRLIQSKASQIVLKGDSEEMNMIPAGSDWSKVCQLVLKSESRGRNMMIQTTGADSKPCILMIFELWRFHKWRSSNKQVFGKLHH